MASQKRVTKRKVREILTTRLRLRDPEIILEEARDGRIFGDVISPSFRRKDDYERQVMLRNAFAAELGPDYFRHLGMFLAYTPEEWHIDDLILGLPIPKKAKKRAG